MKSLFSLMTYSVLSWSYLHEVMGIWFLNASGVYWQNFQYKRKDLAKERRVFVQQSWQAWDFWDSCVPSCGSCRPFPVLFVLLASSRCQSSWRSFVCDTYPPLVGKQHLSHAEGNFISRTTNEKATLVYEPHFLTYKGMHLLSLNFPASYLGLYSLRLEQSGLLRAV